MVVLGRVVVVVDVATEVGVGFASSVEVVSFALELLHAATNSASTTTNISRGGSLHM